MSAIAPSASATIPAAAAIHTHSFELSLESASVVGAAANVAPGQGSSAEGCWGGAISGVQTGVAMPISSATPVPPTVLASTVVRDLASGVSVLRQP
jgi:hypothetical protein